MKLSGYLIHHITCSSKYHEKIYFLTSFTFGRQFNAWNPPAAIPTDICKDVAIKIKNGTRDEIKVAKFEYFDVDENKYRTKNLLSLDEKQNIKRGQAFEVTRDLGQVSNDKTKS